MPKRNLTVQAVRGLPIPERGRVDYQDTTVPGLILRVNSSGRKSWSVSYWKDGRRPRVTLGVTDDSPKQIAGPPRLSLAEAREKAKAVLREVRIGVDPAAERQKEREAATYAELAREYLERHSRPKKAPRSAREDENRINNLLIPRWGSRKAHDVTRRDVVELLDEYLDAGKPYARNRVQALVSGIFNFGIDRAVPGVTDNPARRLADHSLEKPRVRVLSDEELRVLLPLFDAEGMAGLGFRLLLLTGQRPGEVFGMRWSEIDGDTWRLPAERSKNRRPHDVPLSPQARQILQRLRVPRAGSEWVFPSRNHGKPFTSYGKAARNVKAAGKLSESWNVYDLKSACLTGLERLGVPGPVISAVANHAPQTVTTRHYALHDYASEKREALDRWGRHVEALHPAHIGEVVELRGRA